MPEVRLEYEIRLELVIWNLTIVDLGERSKVVAGSMATRLTGSTTPRVGVGCRFPIAADGMKGIQRRRRIIKQSTRIDGKAT